MEQRVRVSEDLVETRLVTPGAVLRPGPVLGLLAFVVVVLTGIGMAAVAVAGDQPTWAVLFVTLSAMVLVSLLGLVAAALPRRRHWLRVRTSREGVEVVGSPWPARAGVLLAGVAVVGLLAGALVLARSSSRSLDTIAPVLVLGGFAVGGAWTAIRYAVRRQPLDAILLRREGLTVRRGRSTESFGWGQVTGFRVGKGGLTLDLLGHSGTSVPVPTSELRSDPAVVAELLEFYRTHERERSELGSGRAADRVRTAAFSAAGA